MTTYMLTCACSAAIPVGLGQAGGQVVCGRCGQVTDVPRLGELTLLRVAAPVAKAGGRWSAAHGCLLGGMVVASLALAAASYLGMPPRPAFDAAAIHDAVHKAPITEIYLAWQAISRTGIARARSMDEERIDQLARSARSVATLLWGVAAGGAAVAIGGGVALARRRRLSA